MPAGWTCQPLTQLQTGSRDLATAEFVEGSWTIRYGTDIPVGTEFCPVMLGGPGVEYGSNFYIKAQFTRTGGTNGPYGGIAYNMASLDNFNYVYLRHGLPNSNALEVGYSDNGDKQLQGQQEDSVIANRDSTSLNLELLVNDGQENLWINGQLKAGVSSVEPHFATPGPIGLFLFGKASKTGWELHVNGLQYCNPVTCTKADKSKMEAGETYIDEDDMDKTCTCTAEGIICVCGSDISCPGQKLWTDPESCESMCIPSPGYCSSTGDPHYNTFDHAYYDFHGKCTYQAATCGDFTVFFENYDLGPVAPRYTGQIKLEYKGEKFIIMAGNQATVNGGSVVTPYRKDYTDGSYVLIQYNGALEIILYSKGRKASVRLRAGDAGSYINAEMWLHGSCQDLTDGLCGNWNGNAGDDSGQLSWNDHSEHFKKFDNKCPGPPEPWHPCDDIEDGYQLAAAICDAVLESAPFDACNAAVDPAGVKENCYTDVCYCFIDKDCACSQYDAYASSCNDAGINLDNWRIDVAYCPFICPEGMSYAAAGADPAPTCQNNNPDQTGTQRGCFCPSGEYMQDGVCVTPDLCKCIHEGVIYNNGQSFVNEGLCLDCVCGDAGAMNCQAKVCRSLTCRGDQIMSFKDDLCCPYCNSEWVVAVNPANMLNEGQDIVLICDILARGVKRKNIKWFKDGVLVKDDDNIDISKNKKTLSVEGATADDGGTYTCQATLDDKVKEADFTVEVVVTIKKCTHEDGTQWESGDVYNPTDKIDCTCDDEGEHDCTCKVDDTPCGENEEEQYNDDCVKECIPHAVILEPVTPVTCKENRKGCQIKCEITIADGSKPKKANAGWYKQDGNGKRIKGAIKKGSFIHNIKKKAVKKAAGSYFCKYTHNGVEYISTDPVVVTVVEQNTEVTLTPITTTVKCIKNKARCVIKCDVEMADGKRVYAKNAAFYKDLGNGALGPKLKAIIRGGNMQTSFGKKTPEEAAGSYICKYTHKGTEYTSEGQITVEVSEKVKG